MRRKDSLMIDLCVGAILLAVGVYMLLQKVYLSSFHFYRFGGVNNPSQVLTDYGGGLKKPLKQSESM